MPQQPSVWTTPEMLATVGFAVGIIAASGVWLLVLKQKVRRHAEGIRRESEQVLATLRRSQQQEKMEAIGKFAGGVAHSFNNYLTSILGYSELLLETTAAADPSRHGIEAIKKSAERGSQFTRQLFILNRRQALQPEALSLNTVLTAMEPTLRQQLSETVELRVSSDSGLGTVKTDRAQMEQVITHLVLFARDTLPGAGLIEVEARNTDLDAPLILDFCELKPGPYVLLQIRDNGPGMEESQLKRAFEPFSIPRQKSKGSGLALALAYNMIQQNGGEVAVTSQSGKGTAFTVYFPRLQSPQTGG